MHIGNKINLLIHSDKKFSKKDLANYLNKTRQAIYDIIKNPDINTRTLRKIADYFDVDISYFIEDGLSLPTSGARDSGEKNQNSRRYIEDRLTNVERRLSKLERAAK